MLILIILTIFTLVLETTIARLYTFFSPGPQSLYINLLFFTAAIIIFSGVHVLILYNIRNQIKSLFLHGKLRLKLTYSYVLIVQFILNGLLFGILYETALHLYYSTNLILMITCISYASGIVNLGILAERFFKWYFNNKNSISLLFGISTLSILVNTFLTAVFVFEVLLTQPEKVGWHTGSTFPTSVFSWISIFENLYSISFSISYILTWISTVYLMKNYAKRLGVRKFWIIVALPLLYIIGQFQPIILPLLYEFRYYEPVIFTIVYTLFFTILKVSGAIFFGIGLWAIGRKAQQPTIKSLLSMSGYGLILIFVSNQATLLISYLFPPLGIAAVCFVGLSSFLLLAGTYSAAISVANDLELRKSIRRSVLQEFELLTNISQAEMEFQIRNKVLSTMGALSSRLRENTGVDASLSSDEIVEYTNSAIQEVLRHKASRQNTK